MQAIETKYAGRRFRSRLEARWAVVFDGLGIPYEYEPEGFETAGGWYLPDFRLWGHFYAEVKREYSFEERCSYAIMVPWMKKCSGFVHGDLSHRLALLMGQPRVKLYPVWIGSASGDMQYRYIDFGASASKGEPCYDACGKQPEDVGAVWSAAIDQALAMRFDGKDAPVRTIASMARVA